MKLYRTLCLLPSGEARINWAATHDEREGNNADILEADVPVGSTASFEWECVEVPTTRDDLVAWLNANATTPTKEEA